VIEKVASYCPPGATSGRAGPPVTRALVGAVIGSKATTSYAGAFASCTSPHTVKVKIGRHTFQVQAIDEAGNVGTPATDTWKRKKKK
jgi:hypothetical protein